MTRASSVTLPGGLQLSYAEVGDGPVVLLMPGPTDSRRSYDPVLERMPRSVRAIALSPRGHGDSAKPATGYAIEDLAGDVVAFLDALRIERAVLAGHSGSCLVARHVALRRPDRVAGLVFEASPLLLKGHAGLEAFVTSVVAPLRDPIDPDFARSFVVDTSSEHVDAEALAELAVEVLKVPARVWHEVFADLLRYDDLAELPGVSAPALLIWGDADPLVSREAQDQLLARLPDAQLIVYQGVGHTPRWEDPTRFATDVTSFVRTAHGSADAAAD